MSNLATVIKWVDSMNQYPGDMILELIRVGHDNWCELTTPCLGDKVFLRDVPINDPLYGEAVYGTVKEIQNDFESYLYSVELKNGSVKTLSLNDIRFMFPELLPSWSCVWSFKDPKDIQWIEEFDGLEALSENGFRVFFHEKWGYFFGIGNSGYDFYKEHWNPVFDRRLAFLKKKDKLLVKKKEDTKDNKLVS